MHPDRRRLLHLTGLGVLIAAPAAAQPTAKPAIQPGASALVPNSDTVQTAALQAAIDAAAANVTPLVLPPGIYRTRTLSLRPGTVLAGSLGRTTLLMTGEGPILQAQGCEGLRIFGLSLLGGHTPAGPSDHAAIAEFEDCRHLDISDVLIRQGVRNGIGARACSGRIASCDVTDVADAAIFALDSTLTISNNTISGCGNNGILIWRSKPQEDGSQVTGNRIANISANAGGSGQNGNGINVFRAGSVQVSGNRITDCAYSAIRGNAASNVMVTGNHCERSGEVAIYAEFAFTGALIANNLIDAAATGISVTNFNEGGRLAVVQGNLIRNLVRREQESADKRGEGIAVEADTIVTGNTIENAATCGIWLGTGRYMRDVTASANLIRNTPVGILISADPAAGRALVTGNMISGTKDGAIRAQSGGHPFGPDLAREPATSGRVTISGNSAA